MAHGSRPLLKKGQVAHVTIKLISGLPSLRKGEALEVVLAAIKRVNQGGLIRIVEFSIQSNHVHLIVEAPPSLALGLSSPLQASQHAPKFDACNRGIEWSPLDGETLG